jgi:hypothetical protein
MAAQDVLAAFDGWCNLLGQHACAPIRGDPFSAVRYEPPGLHKDGEKYLATHPLARCGAQGGEVVRTDNDKRELSRFNMRESGECYVFDDDRIWHMLTPVETLEVNQFAYRDTLTFDLLPDAWKPVS